jgi:hypothetical protein
MSVGLGLFAHGLLKVRLYTEQFSVKSAYNVLESDGN